MNTPNSTTPGSNGCSPKGFARLQFVRSAAVRAVCLAIAFGFAITVPANAIWVGIKTGTTNTSVTVDLKTAGPGYFGVLSYGSSSNTVNLGSGTFNGSFGDVAVNPSMNGATINGNVYLGNGISTTNFLGHGTINGTVNLNQTTQLSQPKTDATAAAIDALTIKSTITSPTSITDSWFGGLTSKTITGSAVAGATNVIKLSSINMTLGQQLVLKAGAVGQKFLIEVTGTFNLSGSSDLRIDNSNGLTPLDVLYVLGSGTNLTATGTAGNSSIIDGILLSHYGNINITYGQVNGAVIGNCDLVFANTNVSSIIPEVSAFFPLLGLFSLVAGGRVVARRGTRSAIET